MRIVNPMKTGRGFYVKPFARMRSVSMSRKMKGGNTTLLLSPGLGVSDGPSTTNEPMYGDGMTLGQSKQKLENVVKKLEGLQMKTATKKKNISFQI